jgi:hypothetical protein
MKKQTAVEWLVEKMLNQDWYTYKSLEYIQQAKEMEKEQKGYSLDDVKNALHSVELKDNKNYSKIWAGMENWFELIKQQEQ